MKLSVGIQGSQKINHMTLVNFLFSVLTYNGWIALTFGADIHALSGFNWNKLDENLTFNLAAITGSEQKKHTAACHILMEMKLFSVAFLIDKSAIMYKLNIGKYTTNFILKNSKSAKKSFFE